MRSAPALSRPLLEIETTRSAGSGEPHCTTMRPSGSCHIARQLPFMAAQSRRAEGQPRCPLLGRNADRKPFALIALSRPTTTTAPALPRRARQRHDGGRRSRHVSDPQLRGWGPCRLEAAHSVPPEIRTCDRRPRQANAVLQTVPDKSGLPLRFTAQEGPTALREGRATGHRAKPHQRTGGHAPPGHSPTGSSLFRAQPQLSAQGAGCETRA